MNVLIVEELIFASNLIHVADEICFECRLNKVAYITFCLYKVENIIQICFW